MLIEFDKVQILNEYNSLKIFVKKAFAKLTDHSPTILGDFLWFAIANNLEIVYPNFVRLLANLCHYTALQIKKQ